MDMSWASSGRSTLALGLKAGIRPSVGLMVETPLHEAGPRREPPMSLPWAMAPIPAATEAPAPPDEPPQVIAASQGLRVRPCRGLSVNARIENSGVLVRPMMIAPAFLRLATTGASSVAIVSFSPTTPLELAWPVTSMLILIVTGTPCSGPRALPLPACLTALSGRGPPPAPRR